MSACQCVYPVKRVAVPSTLPQQHRKWVSVVHASYLIHDRMSSRKFIKIKTAQNDTNVLIEHHDHGHHHHNNNEDKEGIKQLTLKISFIHRRLKSIPL
jgi:hypothetical protein